jgi:hypothetical protein
MFLDEGLSLLRICLKLREQGIKIARKEPKPSTISHILKNELYTGTCVVNQFCYNEKGQKLYYTTQESTGVSGDTPLRKNYLCIIGNVAPFLWLMLMNWNLSFGLS